MELNTQMREAQEKTRLALSGVYELWDVGREYKSSKSKADLAAWGAPLLTDSVAGRCLQTFEELGIIRRQIEYNYNDEPGRHYHLTVMVDREKAFALVEAELKAAAEEWSKNRVEGIKKGTEARNKTLAAKKLRKDDNELLPGPVHSTVETPQTNGVALATRDSEEVRAIAGPEPSKSFAGLQREPDHAVALIEAARQYRDRDKTIREKVEALIKTAKDLGVTVDEEQLMPAFDLGTDERLEIISAILPHVDQLERTVERQATQLVEQKRKLADYDLVRSERDRLKKRLDAQIASNVASARAMTTE